MNKRMCFLWVSAGLLCTSWIANGQDSIPWKKLSFEQALTLTLHNSHIMKQAEYLKEEKDEAVKAARGLYFPKIGLVANYMVMSEDLSLDLTPVKSALEPLYKYGTFSGVPNPDPATQSVLPILPDNLSTQVMRTSGLQAVENADWNPVIQKRMFGTVAATFQLPVFTGGKIAAANKVAQIELNEADQVSRQKTGELTSELVERYFGLSLATEAVRVRREVLKGMNQHLADAEKLFSQGLIANADVLHAHVYQAQAKRELDKSIRESQILNQSLMNTLAMDTSLMIDPVTPLFYLDSVAPLDTFIRMAREQNPLLQEVDRKKLLAEQNCRVQRAEYFPEIALQGMYDIANKDLSPYLPDWTIGIGLKWTLFDGAARHRKVAEAVLKEDQVEEFRLKASSDITTMITKLYNELNMYHEQLTELETALHYANAYVKVREKAFHEQMTNETDVVDANLSLEKIRIERLQVMYGYDLTLAQLLQYAGAPEKFLSYRQKAGVKTESYR